MVRNRLVGALGYEYKFALEAFDIVRHESRGWLDFDDPVAMNANSMLEVREFDNSISSTPFSAFRRAHPVECRWIDDSSNWGNIRGAGIANTTHYFDSRHTRGDSRAIDVCPVHP